MHVINLSDFVIIRNKFNVCNKSLNYFQFENCGCYILRNRKIPVSQNRISGYYGGLGCGFPHLGAIAPRKNTTDFLKTGQIRVHPQKKEG